VLEIINSCNHLFKHKNNTHNPETLFYEPSLLLPLQLSSSSSASFSSASCCNQQIGFFVGFRDKGWIHEMHAGSSAMVFKTGEFKYLTTGRVFLNHVSVFGQKEIVFCCIFDSCMMYIDSKHTFVIIAVIQHQHIQVRRIPPPQDHICTCISPFNPLKAFWAPELKSLRTLTLHLCQSQACRHSRCLATLLQVVFATALHTLHYVNQPAPTFEQPWHNYNPLLDITKSRMKLMQSMKRCCNHTISSPLNQASRNFWQLGAFGDLHQCKSNKFFRAQVQAQYQKFVTHLISIHVLARAQNRSSAHTSPAHG